MRQNRIGRSELLLNCVERLLRLALARDDAECPICNLLAPGEPFVRPREKNRACQTAFYNAVDMRFGRHDSFHVDGRMVPAKPHFTTLSICQPSISACSSCEWR